MNIGIDICIYYTALSGTISTMKSAVVLILVEGWGIGSEGQENPLYSPQDGLNRLGASYPSIALHAAGVPVGLEWEEAGDGRFGGAIIGAGRQLTKAEVAEGKPISGSLGEAIANAGKQQLRIAETATYPLVTSYLNGFHEEAFPGEFRIHIPSEQYARPEEHPALMAKAVTDRLVMSLREGVFDFIAVSYANLDLMAGTGSYRATAEAAAIMESELTRVIDAAAAGNYTLLITSSHGNAEEVQNPRTGAPDKENNPNPVPLIAIGPGYPKRKEPKAPARNPSGIITDIAPTILELLGIRIPPEMGGASLTYELR